MNKDIAQFTTVFVLAILISTVVGAEFIGQVNAWNTPHELEGFIPATIKIVSPQNTTYTDFVPIKFIATSGGFEPNSPYSGYQLFGGGYSYSLDGQANVSIAGDTTLADLGTGSHWIVIYAHYYVSCGQFVGPFSDGSEPIYFAVISTALNMSIQNPQNKTYNTNEIALNFTVDKPTSTLTYSLDNKANVTITGNTTLSGLSDGFHQVTIYAEETTDSQTVYFNIEASEPQELQTITILSISGVSAAVVGIAIIIHKKRHR
jgi:hypothetical protein